jgi:tRNA threonylcarbamoyladenosine biosynthesis protein TsaE
MDWPFLSQSPEETMALGGAIARSMTGEMVIALVGPLGAGKTLLTKGIASANASGPCEVTSPTFTLVQEYRGRLTIFHLDVYRLANPKDPLFMALDEMVRPDTVAIIEWADRVQARLNYDTLWITIQPHGETARLFTMRANGLKSRECLDVLRTQFVDTSATHS